MGKRTGLNSIKSFFEKEILVGVFLVSFQLLAQNNTRTFIHEEKVFFGYFNQTRLSNNFGLWFDFHHRTINNFIREPHQSIGRSALSYFVNDNFRIMAGYAFAYNHSNSQSAVAKIEHRPWQQLFFKTHYGHIHSIQMLRLEERYLQVVKGNKVTDDYTNVNRIRYSHLFMFPFDKNGIVPGSFFGILNNEVFINFGKNVRANVFDQNRFFVGVGYQFSKLTALHFGYMNIIQQLQNGFDFINSNCIRVFLFQSFDLRKN